MVKNKPKMPEGASPEVNMRNQLKEMELEMEKNNNYVKGFKEKEAALQEQIKGITMMMEKHRLEYKNDINQANKTSDAYKDQIEKLNEKMKVLRKENEKLAVDLSNTKLKFNHANGKFEQISKRKKELQENEEEYKKNISELKEKLAGMIDLKKSSNRNSNTTEIKLKKVITQAQILRDEVFRKDSELVKAARERMKFEQEIDGLKGTHSKLNAKMKTIEAETIERISKELEEKERQIEILKEMLRAAHSEIKLKDSKITTLNRKTEEVERMRSPKRN
jgi:chromosome segregation ATPase